MSTEILTGWTHSGRDAFAIRHTSPFGTVYTLVCDAQSRELLACDVMDGTWWDMELEDAREMFADLLAKYNVK